MRGWDPPSLRLRLFHLPAPSLQTATAADAPGAAGAAGTALPPCLPQRQQRPPCRIDPCPSLTLPQFQALPICPLGTRNSVRAAPVNTGALSSHLPYSPPLDLTSPAPASHLIQRHAPAATPYPLSQPVPSTPAPATAAPHRTGTGTSNQQQHQHPHHCSRCVTTATDNPCPSASSPRHRPPRISIP